MYHTSNIYQLSPKWLIKQRERDKISAFLKYVVFLKEWTAYKKKEYEPIYFFLLFFTYPFYTLIFIILFNIVCVKCENLLM